MLKKCVHLPSQASPHWCSGVLAGKQTMLMEPSAHKSEFPPLDRLIGGVHRRYSIPTGNLFPPGTPNTSPLVYVMGNRNPFRISVDNDTGWIYWGEVRACRL